MRRPAKLPSSCSNKIFTLAEARAAGISDDRLRSSDVESLGRLIFQNGKSGTLAEHARALSVATPGAWISHHSAAALHGLWLPWHIAEAPGLHLSKPRALPEVRRRGVSSHNVHVLPNEIEELQGIRISSAARTWLDLARYLPLRDLIAMGDQLVRQPRPGLENQLNPFSSTMEITEMLKSHPNMQGIRIARIALEQIRTGSDSAPESFLRLALIEAGLPEPELQVMLDPSHAGSPQCDLGYRNLKIGIQYDGGHHLTPEQQSSDNRRDEQFLRSGWAYFRFNREDLKTDFKAAVVKIRRAINLAKANAAPPLGLISRL